MKKIIKFLSLFNPLNPFQNMWELWKTKGMLKADKKFPDTTATTNKRFPMMNIK
jgi:hypothetical protein